MKQTKTNDSKKVEKLDEYGIDMWTEWGNIVLGGKNASVESGETEGARIQRGKNNANKT